MTKFRSLIFREFKVCKKNYTLNFLILLVFSLFLIIAAFIFNGISGESPEGEKMVKTIIGVLSATMMLTSSMPFMDEIVLKSDLNSGWSNYSYVLPITASQRAAVKFVRYVFVLAISVLITMISVITLNKITGNGFKLGYVILQLIFVDMALIPKIIIEFFTLRARNTDEHKKMQSKGNRIFMIIMICVALIVMKFAGVDFASLLESDSSEPLSFDIISKLTGKMLIWLIPLTLVLFVVYYAVIYDRSRSAYPSGVIIKNRNDGAEKSVDLTAPHSEPVGFLYKELRQNMKSIFAVMLLPFFIMLLITVCLAIVSLNEEYGGDDWVLRTLTSDLFRLASVGMGFYLVSGLLLSVFHGDDRKLWAYFTASAPKGVSRFLYTKYVLSFAMCGLYFVSCYVAENLLATIHWFVLGEEMMSFTSIFVMIFFALVFMNSISIPLMLRFGEKKGSLIILIAILFLAIAGMVILAIILENNPDKVFEWLIGFLKGEHGGLTMLLVGLFPAFSVGAYILSYKISCSIFMKGVNEYDK